MTDIGDINKDNLRQHHPDLVKTPSRHSIDDIVIGCPQGNVDGAPGRIFLIFLNENGLMRDYTEIPGRTDAGIAPTLSAADQFGSALASVADMDGTGIRGIAVGAPGDGHSSGAVYLIFLRRRRYHRKIFSLLLYLLPIVIPAFVGCCICCLLIAYFFWYFRRRPDEIEIIVKKAGLERSRQRRRKILDFGKDKVHAESYEL